MSGSAKAVTTTPSVFVAAAGPETGVPLCLVDWASGSRFLCPPSTQIAEMTLTKWNDPVPPPSVRKLGDDGMSDLSPDAYVDFRVKRKMELYNRDVLEIGKTLRNMSILSYCLGALGTVLAVLAVQPTLSQWNLQVRGVGVSTGKEAAEQ